MVANRYEFRHDNIGMGNVGAVLNSRYSPTGRANQLYAAGETPLYFCYALKCI